MARFRHRLPKALAVVAQAALVVPGPVRVEPVRALAAVLGLARVGAAT
ncbi:MAG: hypothetical protein J0H38_14530 [Rhizobiales bacterium]|nr:hypothetical protein [Hyphomicrobiales bacterium]